MDVFSQTTICESTEVPKPCFSPATHSVTVSRWLAANGNRNSAFTNKLERQTHGTELRIGRVSSCFEAASEKADFFSQSDNDNRPIKQS